MPAFLTAEDTAFTAVCMKLMSCEKSPVAEACFFCSASIYRVSVIGSVSIGLLPLILDCLNQCQQQCATTCYLYNLYKRLSTRQQQYGLDIKRVWCNVIGWWVTHLLEGDRTRQFLKARFKKRWKIIQINIFSIWYVVFQYCWTKFVMMGLSNAN